MGNKSILVIYLLFNQKNSSSDVLFGNKVYVSFWQESKFFFVSGFSFTTIQESQDCRGKGKAFHNSSLTLPPASQTQRH